MSSTTLRALACGLLTLTFGCGTPETGKGTGQHEAREVVALPTPAPARPPVSSEFELATPLVTSSHFEATDPAVAFGDGVFLTVWTSILSSSGSNRDILGRRFAPNGTPIDETAFSIVRVQNTQQVGCVGFDGTNFLVVYNTSPGASATRVTPEGVVLDPLGIRLDDTFAAQDIAFDGTNYLIVGSGLRALRVSPAGSVLSDLPLGTGFAPAVAWNGEQFLVTYRREISSSVYSMHGRNVTSNALGNEFLVDAQVTRPTNDAPTATAIASNGDDWFVFYNDFETVVGARINAMGMPVGEATPGITVRSGLDATYFADGYYVFSSSAAGIHAVKLSDTGSIVAGPSTFTTPYSAGLFPKVADDGANPFVVFYENHDLVGDVFARRFTQALGAIGSNIPVSEYANLEDDPSVGSNGTNYLVVWRDFTEDDSQRVDLVGTRVAPSRRVLDPDGIVIDDMGAVQSPNVASNGTDFLVGWTDRMGNLRGARVRSDGRLLDPGGFLIADVQSGSRHFGPVLGSDGTDYLALWTTQTGTASVIRSGRVTAGGMRLDGAQGVQLSQTAGSAAPSLAWNGTHYLAAWQATNVIGARLDAAGARIDMTDVTIALNGGAPSVTTNGTDWLVAWRGPGGSNISIYATRVRADGTVLDAPGPLLASTAVGPARAAWNGTDYLVAWSDSRNAATNPFGNNQNYDVMSSRVTTAGESLDPTGFAVASSVEAEWTPALAAGTNQVLAVYPRLDPDPPFTTLRVRGKIIGEVLPDGEGGAGGEPSGGTGGAGEGGASDGGADSGGTGGSGGAQGGTTAGGRSGAGGTSGSAADAGEAGAPAGGSSSGAAKKSSEDDGGCGCHVGARPSSGSLAGTALALLALSLLRRRRTRE